MGTIVEVNFREVDDKIIEEERLFNVYLLGVPRSGTSMMTRVLELLGVNMMYTSENDKEKTDKRFKDKYGEYHANPTGFFEVTERMLTNLMTTLGKRYSGCKMIVPVQGIRWEMLLRYPCKVILMNRDVEEIRQSQMAYYRTENIEGSYIAAQLATQTVRLKKSDIEYMILDYHDVLDNKEEVIPKVAKFVNAPNDIQPALDFINPKQNRYKRKELTDGL